MVNTYVATTIEAFTIAIHHFRVYVANSEFILIVVHTEALITIRDDASAIGSSDAVVASVRV
jgi:hypothetical protein